ncbi:hypothetical protein P691DRAFT_657131 [Macrolepiota fuliginosa MF-IS2]|uniref:Uncharacterized protein n=1 Tax=Macrolepiota fuliginosa MF-IS2 TaxID=1400762 RepID=A0A9P5XRD9_9AGAR|nr:hypothetical protein P691DRAFT_657131 [Macrolepiota fuliginosa MF-IS2]
MSTDIIGCFSPLDELIQLIYQSIYQFVVMSSVTYDKWTVHVGMVGDAGRWWRGVWEEKNVVGVVGHKPSEKLLEVFVDGLVDSIVGGELYLAGFSTEKDARFKLTFGPVSTRPVSMDLQEIGPAEAAAHATTVFLEIALQAQSRKCRLHSSAFTSTTVPTTSRRSEASHSKTRLEAPEPKVHEVETGDVEDEVKSLRKKESEKQTKRQRSPLQKAQPSAKPPPRRPGKAAALANPNKKARKFQAIDFESDEE